MKSINEQLSEHFLLNYGKAKSFPLEKSPCVLTCEHAAKCNFKGEHEASFSGALGDEQSRVMVIAESPSTGWGKGSHFSGLTKNLASDKGKKVTELMILLDYIKDVYGYYPYFTDWIKCGLAKTREKEVLNKRKYFCVEAHLKKEILIINPEKIVCLGTDCYNDVRLLVGRLFPDKDIDSYVVRLTHFSRRASLPLSIEDKKQVIWQLELGRITELEVAKTLALRLSHLAKKLPKL